MKKRILATVMTLTLGAAMLTACGSGADETPVESAVVEETNNIEPTTEAADVTATTEEADADATEEAATETATAQAAN